MTKSYSKKEFDDMLTSALMSLVDQAKERDCGNAATSIMMTGVLILSEIKHSVFDDNTDTITVVKE